MNLHITNDNLGIYPLEIAKRIKNSGLKDNNRMINLSIESIYKDETITYIPFSKSSFQNYLEKIEKIEKVIFHPYQYNSYLILKILKKKYPKIKVYWAIWSSELFCLPPLPRSFYGPFSEKYIKNSRPFIQKIKGLKFVGNPILQLSYFTGIRKNHIKKLKESFSEIDFFCSLLPSDFSYFKKKSGNNKTEHLPFAYLSLEQIMPTLNTFNSSGNKIMIGHSASPKGNHFEILSRLYELNKDFSIFLPLAYGEENYGNLIKSETLRRFTNAEILTNKMKKSDYYYKLTEVGWAIINVKVQQGLGNIIALIWMGVKVFLDEESSTYIDFKSWGINIFSIKHDLNLKELTEKLSPIEVSNNKKIILEKCNEEAVKGYWEPILN